MTETMIETERKFAVPNEFEMPGLRDVAPEVIEQGTVELRATYFDTVDFRLLRSGVTLRRRVGGSDAGWHLKLTTAEENQRLEVHRPLGPDAEAATVPPELAELVFGRTRGAALAPVAELRTARTTVELRDRAGTTLVLVADDVVTASAGGSRPTGWREVEVERSPDGRKVAEQVEAMLMASGARPDKGGPKLAHALGIHVGTAGRPVGASSPGRGERHVRQGKRRDHRDHRGGGNEASPFTGAGSDTGTPTRLDPTGAPVVPPELTAPGPSSEAEAARLARRAPAFAAVLSRLAEQAEELALRDVEVRRDEDDGVHKMRVACRRLSSCLRSFGELFDAAEVARLRGEVSWLAHLLGEARDFEVLRAAIEADLDRLPPEQVLGPVRATLSARLGSAQAVAGEALGEAMQSARYAALLDSLSSLVAAPPLRPASTKKRERLVTRSVRRDLRRVRRRMRAAERLSGERRDLMLHEARKDAKRARYAVETVTPAFASQAASLAERYTALQQALGDHHDAVVTGTLLREEGARAGVRPGENGYTFGLLAGLARCRADASEAAAWRIFERADRAEHRRFLR